MVTDQGDKNKPCFRLNSYRERMHSEAWQRQPAYLIDLTTKYGAGIASTSQSFPHPYSDEQVAGNNGWWFIPFCPLLNLLLINQGMILITPPDIPLKKATQTLRDMPGWSKKWYLRRGDFHMKPEIHKRARIMYFYLFKLPTKHHLIGWQFSFVFNLLTHYWDLH